MALLNAANHGPEVLRLSAFAVCVIEAIRGFFAHLGAERGNRGPDSASGPVEGAAGSSLRRPE